MRTWPLLFAAILLAAPARARTPMRTAVIREGTLPPVVAAVDGRDPFNWPPRQERRFTAMETAGAADPLAGVRLEGIIHSVTRPLALINGRILTVGDRVAGYRIVAITRHLVSLRRGRRTRNLKLPAVALRLESTRGEKK